MITCTFEKGDHASLRHVVVHALAVKDGKILLGKRAATLSNGGLWCLPGGFLNRDETAAQGALRELREETGWEGEIVALFSIITRPDRPKEDRQNVALTFLVKPVGKITEPDTESTHVEWIPLDKLPPPDEFAFDHGDIIDSYISYKKKPAPLPIVV